MVNVLHAGLPGDGWSSSEMSDFAGAFANAFSPTYKSYFSSDLTLEELRFYSLDVLNPPPTAMVLDGVTIIDQAFSGAAGTELPPQDACTVTWRTASRRHWGRIYLGDFVEAANDNGRLGSSVVDEIATNWTSIMTTLNGLDTPPIVYNRSSLSGISILAVEVDDVWDIQRRRRFDTSTHRVVNTL